MPPTPKRKPDPNELRRIEAGLYRTGDDRFEVRNSGVGWLLVDGQATDELGQPLVRGPFPNLQTVRNDLPDARRSTLAPLRGKKRRA